jgi:predicted dehydrogenase
MPPLRVALLGFGLAGEAFHAPLIGAVEDLELALVLTRDPARGQRARALGAEVVSDPTDVWGRAGELDLVVVATPNRTHVPLARAAIDAGLAVVVDKPLAGDAAAARGLTEHAHERGVLLVPFQNRRWDGDHMTLRGMLAKRELGDVWRLESHFARWRPSLKPGWRELADPEEGGGVLVDLGAHLVDQALELLGPARSVYAEVDVRRAGAQVDDDAFVALEHEGGARSHLWMSQVHADESPRLRVLGARGAYVKSGLDPQEAQLRAGMLPRDADYGEEPQELWGTFVEGDTRRPVPTVRGAYPAFYEGVAHAVLGEKPAPVDPWDAVRALEILDAARRSAAERRVVALGEDAR